MNEEVTAEYRHQFCFNTHKKIVQCKSYQQEGCPECCDYAFQMNGRQTDMGEDSGLADRLNQEKLE
jgi:hypothetical protein